MSHLKQIVLEKLSASWFNILLVTVLTSCWVKPTSEQERLKNQVLFVALSVTAIT